jgi:uncharacterized repeat protein (TIGR03803 family)
VAFKLSPAGILTVLHNFTGGADGEYPYGGLVSDRAGNLYGTTIGGGAHGAGVIFKLIPCDSGYEYKLLYSFTGGADGGLPYARLIRDAAGNLYGTTTEGGVENDFCDHGSCGVVFKLTSP